MALLDRAGIVLSSLCLIHCLAIPVLFVFLPMAAGFLPSSDWVHAALIGPSVPITMTAMLRGRALHGLNSPAIFAAIGLQLMILALFLGGETMERVLTSFGGMLVVLAHYRNWRAHQIR